VKKQFSDKVEQNGTQE